MSISTFYTDSDRLRYGSLMNGQGLIKSFQTFIVAIDRQCVTRTEMMDTAAMLLFCENCISVVSRNKPMFSRGAKQRGLLREKKIKIPKHFFSIFELHRRFANLRYLRLQIEGKK